MALANGVTCTVQTYRIFCKFFSESGQKKIGYGRLKNSGERSRAILALLFYKLLLLDSPNKAL